MTFEELTTLVGDNEDAKNFIKGVQSTQEENVQQINNHEVLINKLKEDKTNFTRGNELVKSKFGFEKVNEETIDAYLQSQSKKGGDEKALAEIANLQEQLGNANSRYDTMVNDFNGQIRGLKLGTSLTDELIKAGAVESTMALATNHLSQMIGYDDDNNIKITNKDGTTMYVDGEKASLSHLVQSMKGEMPTLFKPDMKSGGDGKPNNGAEMQVKTDPKAQYQEMGFK